MKLLPEPRFADLRDAVDIAQTHVATWRVAYKGLVSDSYLAELQVEARTKAWEQSLAPPIQSNILVVENPDKSSPIKVLGFAVAARLRDENGEMSKDPKDGEVFAIYVHPAHYNKKIGAALMLRCEDLLKRQGQERIYIWYMQGNAQAEKFYHDFGYRPDGMSRAKLFTSSAGSEEKILIRVSKTL